MAVLVLIRAPAVVAAVDDYAAAVVALIVAVIEGYGVAFVILLAC